MAINVTTLGGLYAERDGEELGWLAGQRLRAALFVYLVVEQRVSRESLAAVFWPESSEANGRHALRQSLYALRKAIAPNWLDSAPHELRVNAEVRTDVHAYRRALDDGDPEQAVRLYRGQFLEGIHLLDSKTWESWVDARRLEYARSFRNACRQLVEARRTSGDLVAAIEIARRWVEPDPFDDEGQHQLIDLLADAGERAEALRQFDAYARLLAAEGLRPLEETVALIERLRAAGGTAHAPPTALPSESLVESESVRPTHPSPDLPPEPARSGTPPAPGSTHPRPARTMRHRRALAFLGIAVAAVLAGFWTLDYIDRSEDPAFSSSVVVVLPFTVRGGEEAMFLGDGVVNLLSTAMDGAGPVRTADVRAMSGALAQSGGGPADLEKGRRVAARIGAGLFVLGEIVQAGERVQVEAALYDARPGTELRARAAVSGEMDHLFGLIDELAARLLAGVVGGSADRLTRTAAATTTSLSAFKAYVDGEAHFRLGQFERAAESYVEALAYDSTFAIASYRLALAQDWAALPGFHEAGRAAIRHAARLAPRDRALVEALRAYHEAEPAEAERRYRAILARYPDDLDAWFQLAEVLFHYGPLTGRQAAESSEAWRKVLSFEPRNIGAIMHLARAAAVAGRVADLDSLLASFGAAERAADRRVVQMGIFRAASAGDTAAAAELAQLARGWEDGAVYQLATHLTAFTPHPASARRAITTWIEPHRDPGAIAELRWFEAVLHLANGQIGASRAAAAEAVAAQARGGAPPQQRVFDHVTEWFAATLPLPYPDSLLERARRSAMQSDLSGFGGHANTVTPGWLGQELWLTELGGTGRMEAVRLYTVGLLSLRLGEPGEMMRASEALGRLAGAENAGSLVRDLDRGLKAWIAIHERRYEEGLRYVEALELEPTSIGAANVVPFASRPNERYLRGELLVALGRPEEAMPWFASLGQLSAAEGPFRAPAHLRLAEIHERLGNRLEAASNYRRVAELWQDGDPEFRALALAAWGRFEELSEPALQ